MGDYIRKTARLNGKKYEATWKTELEAMTKLAEKLAAAKAGQQAVGGSMTVNAWYKEWKATYKDPKGLTPKSLGMYDEKYNGYIKPAIGHMKLKDIRPDHLNSLYSQLAQPGAESAHAIAKVDLAALLKEKRLTRLELSNVTGLSLKAVYAAVKGERVKKEVAGAISTALGGGLEDFFSLNTKERTLSGKTIREYHRLIHTVLDQALKEGLVAVNVADRATPPKMEQKDVNYFQPEQVAEIREALEQEPVKWKTLVHLLLITGARRGEILGLKWDKVDFDNNQVYICNNILYSADVGIYEDTPKTERSKRYISLPVETMQLLRQYRAWQNTERLRLGDYYRDQGFVFAQDNGGPMHPDSVTTWLTRFSKRHGLPHVNAHAFRHTMASMLYFNGVDSVSISKRLGHAQVSTTANIYAHVMEAADKKNADILADVFLKKA